MTSSSLHRPAVATMYLGLALTIVALVTPFFATDVLADHVRAGYPAYSTERIDEAVTAYVTILAVVGVLATVSWAASLWAVHRRKRWARWFAAGAFVVGGSIALSGLLVTDTSGDVGLAPVLAWLVVLPCVAGLAAVALLWAGSSAPPKSSVAGRS